MNATYNGTQTVVLAIGPNNSIVSTAEATSLTSYGATLNGTVNPEGAAGTAYFEFGTNPTGACGCQFTASVGVVANSTAQAISISTSTWGQLASGTTYYYRIQFENTSNGQTVFGPLQQFTTLNIPVTTVGAGTVTSYSATLTGTVNPGGATGVAYFLFGTSPSFTSSTCETQAASVTANYVAQSILGSTTYCNSGGLVTTPYSLASGTIYYYQPVFYNTSNNSTVYGPVQQFTTLATPVTTVGAGTVTSYSATLTGTVNPGGATGVAYFLFGTSPSFTSSTCETQAASVTANYVAQSILGSTTYCNSGGLVTTPYSLASGTVYYYQPVFYNTSNNSTVYGPVQQFTTLATPVTTVGAGTVPATVQRSQAP